MSARAASSSPARPVDTVTVQLAERSYPIVIGNGLLAELGARLAVLEGARAAAVITNSPVGKLYRDPVLASLDQAGIHGTVIEIPDGEEHKNLAWLAFIYDRLVDARVERTSPIVALGGGVIGDLAGFAAATFLRGIPFVQVPTTLLAQVDSSVGGKTGINHVAGQNLIGAFYQPRLVVIDVATLRTLPRRELLAGLVEAIKYGVILDPKLFALVEKKLDQILALDLDVLRPIVQRSCALKAMVVQRDERESDYRSILNFGHTLGHAIEAVTEYRSYLHGEAVAIGMAFAARLSNARGYCNQVTMQRIIKLLKRAGLPVDVPAELMGPPLARAIETDKKAAGGKVKFVCIEDLGRTRFEYLTAEEIAKAAKG
jgi:3-dehydroquinate synthase